MNNVDCRPRPAVTLPAAGSAVPITDTVPTADARYGPGIIFTSGPISVSTQGTTGLTGSVTAPIVGIAADPDGAGYWMAGADGGVFAFDAAYSGDVAALLLNSPISGIAALQQPPRPPSDR